MPSRSNGFSLIEVLLAVFVTSICLLGIVKLMSTSQVSMTQSIGSLQAQASAEALMQQIRLMRWDAGMPATGQMPLGGPPIPRVTCGVCSPPRLAVEDWSGFTDTDPQHGGVNRSVEIRFVDIDPVSGELIPAVSPPTHRKQVTITAVGRTSTATITSVFYNLP
jgi:prepilin-type N-terminal cleavage/methylation domain-containing protein